MRCWKQCHRYRYAHQVFVQVHVSNSEPYPQKGPQPVREKMGLKAEFPSAEPDAEVAAQCVGYGKVALMQLYNQGVLRLIGVLKNLYSNITTRFYDLLHLPNCLGKPNF